MCRKMIGILVCMLLVGTVLPVAGTINVKNKVIEEKTSLATGDNPELVIYLPPVHIYFHKLQFIWAEVEFDDPGAVIDVDLSALEVGDLYGINQTVFCHVKDQIKPIIVAYDSDLTEYAGFKSGGLMMIGEKQEWKYYCTEKIRIYEKPEDAYYPITIYATGVPRMLIGPFIFYYDLIYFHQWLNKNVFPCPIHKIFGNSVEYQMHIHS